VLNPIADIWLREAHPDTPYDADFISVWSRNTSPLDDGNNARYGLLSFDLSGVTVPITSARLELYLVDYVRNTRYACKQDAYLVNPPVLDDTGLTWNGFHATNPVETQLQGLGVYSLPTVKPVKQMYGSTATAADVALLEAQRTNGAATFVFKAQDSPTHEEEITTIYGRHDWGDSFNSVAELGMPAPPMLLINGTPIAASVDTWIRELDGQVYENDGISVWHEDLPGDGSRRVGMLEFDLSQVAGPITDAKLAMYTLGPDNTSHNFEAFEQQANLVEVTDGTPTNAIDWAKYTSLDLSPFQAFGHYKFGLNEAIVGQYQESDVASAPDLSALQAIKDAGGKLVISLTSIPQEITQTVTVTDAPGSLDWSDTESTYLGYGNEAPASNSYMWPRLILNSPRLLGDANEDGTVDDEDASVVGANWMAAWVGWAGGDFNEDGIVNDADAAIMAAHWGEIAPTEGGNVPEPSTIALILCGLAALALMRRRATA
jgi:hypothetical protein